MYLVTGSIYLVHMTVLMERIIASAIGVPPEVIWAGRFAHRNFRPTLTKQF